MSCCLHGYPWPSLATFPYCSSFPAGLLDYISYLHIAAVCMFERVVLLLLGHKKGSIEVHHLWARLLRFQQCPTCLVCLTWIIFVMGGRWPYSWCFVGCCHQDLFNIAHNILVELPSSFSSHFVSVQVVHPYSSIDTTAAWKKLRFIFISQVWFPYDLYLIDSCLCLR